MSLVLESSATLGWVYAGEVPEPIRQVFLVKLGGHSSAKAGL